jgi:hypothetical protein
MKVFDVIIFCILSVPFNRLTAKATLSNEEERYSAAYSWPWGEKYDPGYASIRLSDVDFHSKFCFDRRSSSAQFEGNVWD